MMAEFHQSEWDHQTELDARRLIRIAIQEDFHRGLDWTTVALIPGTLESEAAIVARREGIIAGLPVVPLVIDEMAAQVQWQPLVEEGGPVARGTRVGRLRGSARDLLAVERTVLNFLGRMGGIATATHSLVRRVEGTRARIYDTRKTIPGWRSLDKYSVRRGGGYNHRRGLFDAILIKDNHLALGRLATGDAAFSAPQAVFRAKEFIATLPPEHQGPIVEIELDTLATLPEVLATGPDIVLLDNFPPAELKRAVAIRDAHAPSVELEASGNISFETVRAVAETGIERISSGSITHSAANLDLGLDW